MKIVDPLDFRKLIHASEMQNYRDDFKGLNNRRRIFVC